MPLTRITIEEVGSSAPAEKRWLCEMEVGNAGFFRTVHVQAATLAHVLREIERHCEPYKNTTELLAELPKKKRGRPVGWKKTVVEPPAFVIAEMEVGFTVNDYGVGTVDSVTAVYPKDDEEEATR